MKFHVVSLSLLIFATALAAPPAAVTGKMKTLSDRWTKLAPLLFDDNADPAEVKAKLSDVAAAAKDIDLVFHSKEAGDDPLLPLIARSFEGDLQQAVEIAANDRVLQARQWARSALAACVTCHSRAGDGPRFAFSKALAPVLKKASWWDRTAFQAATRQFDPALEEIQRQLRAPSQPKGAILDMEKAVRIGMMIAVRVKEDPVAAAEIADGVGSSGWATASMKERARVWKRDIELWKKESKAGPLATARKLAVDGPDTRGDAGDVRWLRTTALLHAFLQTKPSANDKAEAYFLLGDAYDRMGDLGYWNLGDRYFEDCVREKPHSAMAEKCASRYEESLVLGFSGSRGIDVPAAVRRRVDELKKLAATRH